MQAFVTDHALQRWRERTATHGDETGHHLLKVFNESKVVKKNEPMPFRREDGTTYWYNAQYRCYIVTESIAHDCHRIVSVFHPNQAQLKISGLIAKPGARQRNKRLCRY